MPSLTLMMFVALSAAALQPAVSTQDDADLRGTAGVCIRWADDPDHVADAVVVVGSGNAELDQAMPPSNMKWKRHSSPNYKGEWIGVWMAVNEPGSNRPLPRCNALPLRKH